MRTPPYGQCASIRRMVSNACSRRSCRTRMRSAVRLSAFSRNALRQTRPARPP